MYTDELLQFVFRWGLAGGLLLSAYLIIAWQTGFFGLLRGDPGAAKKRGPQASLLTGLGSILMYIVLMVVADLQDVVPGAEAPRFTMLLAYNYTLYVFWLLFDTIIIDILLVTVWHPRFLRLPNSGGHGSVQYHLRTIPRGLLFGMPVTLVGTGIAYLFTL